jgi:hypothetical protein
MYTFICEFCQAYLNAFYGIANGLLTRLRLPFYSATSFDAIKNKSLIFFSAKTTFERVCHPQHLALSENCLIRPDAKIVKRFTKPLGNFNAALGNMCEF